MANAATSPCPRCGQSGSGNYCSNCGSTRGATSCTKCGTPLTPGARFCHACGATAGTPPRADSRFLWITVAVATTAIIAAIAFTVGRGEGPASVASAPPGQPPAFATQPASDISDLTPRESADRLFNRVMSAAERGDTAEVGFFAPMAIQAYDLVDELDNDARFHMGLIGAVGGDLDAASAQADTLEQLVEGHLLAQVIRQSVAEARGDAAAAREAHRRFLVSYDREMQADRPEYREHRQTIESFRAEANQALGLSGGS